MKFPLTIALRCDMGVFMKEIVADAWRATQDHRSRSQRLWNELA